MNKYILLIVVLLYMGFLDDLLGLIGKRTVSPIPDEPDIKMLFAQPQHVQAQAPMATPSPRPQVTPIPNEYEAMTMPTFDKYNVPREVAYGIRNAEGGKINGFNIGAVDSDPSRAKTFDSLLAEATTAAKMFSGQANPEFYGNGEQGRQQFADANKLDPVAQIKAIMDAGYAGDPKTWKARSSAHNGAGTIFDTYEQFVRNTPAWNKWHGNY